MTELGFALLALLAVGGSVAFVVRPLTRRRGSPGLLWEARNGVVAEEKASLLEALRQLEFDFQLGSLSAEDYHQLEAGLRRRALAALQAEDLQLEELDGAIEQAVEAERARRRRSPGTPERPSGGPVCPRCGWPTMGTERFCPSCGLALARRQPGGRQAMPTARQTVSVHVAPAGRRTASAQRATEEAVSSRTLAPWLWAAAGVAVLLVLGVVWVVMRAPSRAAQAPIATVQASHSHTVAFSPRREELVFLGTHNGLLASIDGGRTWGPQPLAGDVMAITHHPQRPLEVYVTGHNVFARSEDGGRTWGPFSGDLPGLDIHAFAWSPEEPDRAYAFAVGFGLYRSDDAGAHWERLSEQMPEDATGLASGRKGYAALYLSTLSQGVLASEDGRSWRPANGFLNGALPTLRVMAVAFDPNSGETYTSSGGQTYSGTLYAGTDRGLFKSVDAGGSWNRLSLETDVAALAVHPADSRVLLVVDSRGRVFRSEDRGLTWPGD